jgi:PhoH-like ATPase
MTSGETRARSSAISIAAQARQLSDGVAVEQTGGRLRVVLEEDQKICPGLTANTPDNRIICCAKMLSDQGKRVVFISKDINARIKSDALGLTTEDFEAQKVDFEKLYTGYREMDVPSKSSTICFAQKEYRLDAPELLANEFVLLKDETDEIHTAIARYKGDGVIIPVRPKRGPVFGIMPRNLQQTMAPGSAARRLGQTRLAHRQRRHRQDAAGDRGGHDQRC